VTLNITKGQRISTSTKRYPHRHWLGRVRTATKDVWGGPLKKKEGEKKEGREKGDRCSLGKRGKMGEKQDPAQMKKAIEPKEAEEKLRKKNEG